MPQNRLNHASNSPEVSLQSQHSDALVPRHGVGKLPDEILSMIFLFGSENIEGTAYATLLSNVSSRWRAVALSTQRLWSNICMTVVYDISSDREKLRTLLDRAPPSGLSVKIKGAADPTRKTGLHWDEFLNLLSLALTRCSSFALIPGRGEYTTFESGCSFYSSATSGLRRLSLTRTCIEDGQSFLAMLIQCSGVEELSCTDVIETESARTGLVTASSIRPHGRAHVRTPMPALRSLTYQGGAVHAFRHLSFPRLETLSLEGETDMGGRGHILEFLDGSTIVPIEMTSENCLPTLHTLNLKWDVSLDSRWEFIAACLYSLPNLQHVRLEQVYISDGRRPGIVIQHPNPRWTPETIEMTFDIGLSYNTCCLTFLRYLLRVRYGAPGDAVLKSIKVVVDWYLERSSAWELTDVLSIFAESWIILRQRSEDEAAGYERTSVIARHPIEWMDEWN